MRTSIQGALRDDRPVGRERSLRRWYGIAIAALPALLGMMIATGAQAADAYPSKPIRLIVAFPPGGGADSAARPIADALAQELGQPVVVDNKPGGGTTIAAAAAAAAPADGYTLYMSNAGIYGALQTVYKEFRPTAADYTPVALWVSSTLLVAVNNDFGVASVPELITRVKAEPGRYNYASSGAGGGTHLPGVLFTHMTGTDIVHVPYKGGAPAIQGLVSGETQLTFGTPPSVLPLARAGRIRIIATTGAKRSVLFPEVPTVAEGGVPGYEYNVWYGLFGPKGLPREVVDRLFAASNKVLADPALRRKLEATGSEVATSESPAQFARWAASHGKTEQELTVASGAVAQ